jgi:hypothetical protein
MQEADRHGVPALGRGATRLLLTLAVLGLAGPAVAQAPGLALTLTPSHTLVGSGGTLRVSIGATYQGPPVAMDVYFVALLPDGDSLVAVGGRGFAPGRLSQLAALTPFAAGVTLPTGFAQRLDDFLTYTFTGSEPPGLYRFFLAALQPGALADGRVDPGDLLALASAEVAFDPQAFDAVVSVQAGPAGLLLTQIGDSRQLSAAALDAQGNVLNIAIAWTSSDPAVVSVDQAGTVRAAVTSGTARITASVGSVQSEPVYVYVAAPVAGALLLVDSQIVSGPTAVDPGAEPSPDNPYEVVLRGMPSMPLGTILINTGALAVGGRVVDVQPQGSDLRVRLVVVPPQQLFSDFAFKDTVDLSKAPFETPPDIAALYDVAQTGNTFVFTPKPGPPTGVSQGARQAQGTRVLPPLPPFKECEASLEFGSGLPVPLSLSAPPAFAFNLDAMLSREFTSQGRKVVVTGTPTFTFTSVLEIESAFEAKIECKVTLQRRKVRAPGWAGLFFGGDVEFGVGFEVAGKVTLVSAKVGGTATLNTTIEAGVVCPAGAGDCALSGNATATADLAPTFEAPSLNQGRFEPSVTLFAFVTGELGNADVEQLQFEAIEAKVGAKLAASYTLEALQIDNGDPADGRSKYALTIEGEVGPGIKLGEFLEYVGLADFVPLELTFTLPLGKSPTGSVTADRASYLPGERITVRVRLDPASTLFLAGTFYNVDRIVVLRKDGPFSTQALATQPATTGQIEFTLAFDSPGLLNANELFAFVVPRFLPLDPPKLEIGSAQPLPVITFVQTARAFLSQQARVIPTNSSCPSPPSCDVFVHETTGTDSAAEPLHAVSASDEAGQQASASGQVAASISPVADPTGGVTISGSSSGSANAQYQGCCQASSLGEAFARASFTLTGPHSFAIQVTVVETGTPGAGGVSSSFAGMFFAATGAASGVVPAGAHFVAVSAQPVAAAEFQQLSTASSQTVSFTLTLTPQ